MKSRRLIVYAPVIGRGGVHRLVERLVPALIQTAASEGWDIHVLSQPYNELGAPIRWPDNRFTALVPDLMDIPSPTWRLQYLSEAGILFYRQLQKFAQPGDVVWLPHPWYSLRLNYSVLRNSPYHFIPTIHDLAFDTFNWQGFWGDGYRYEMRVFATFASRLIFSSDATRGYARQRYGFPDEKSRTIYLGDFLPDNFVTTSEAVATARQRCHLPPRYFLAFHCSSPSKDLLTIIRGLAIARQQNPSAVAPLVVAGLGTEAFDPANTSNDPYITSVQQAIREANFKPGQNIFFLGKVEDDLIGGLYAGAAASIAASQSEAGLSGTLFETFYARSPAIYSDISQFTERLGTEKVYGLHFQAGSPSDLARAVLELSTDPVQTTQRAQKAFDLVAGRTWEHIAQDYLRVFHEAAGTDPQAIKHSQHAVNPLAFHFNKAGARMFWFRVGRFLGNRLLPKIGLTTYRQRVQAEAALDEVTEMWNQQRQKIAHLGSEIVQLQQTISDFERDQRRIADSMLDEYRQRAQYPANTGGSIEVSNRVDAIKDLLTNQDIPLDVLAILLKVPQMQDQAFRGTLRPLLDQRIIGISPDFWDIRIALNVLSRIIQPRHYLEIGTRLGWSMAQVLAHSPQTQVFSFDMWIQEYAGLHNPGPTFVTDIMQQITAPVIPNIHFITGNSHDTLPEFFDPDRYTPHFDVPNHPSEFDLITVDGDHSLEGAWMDLMAVMPHTAIGGAVVFDDLELSLSNSDIGYHTETRWRDYYPPVPDGLHSLRDVWNAVKTRFPNFDYIESPGQRLAVGIGIRRS